MPKPTRPAVGKSPPRAGLPAALQRNAARLTAQHRSVLLAQIHEDLAVIREKQRSIADAFYDIGEAVIRLNQPERKRLLGVKTFEQLAEKVGLNVSTATSLIEIVQRIKRTDALVWRQDKSEAVIEVARAIAPDGEPATVSKSAIAKLLPKGTTLAAATAKDLRDIASHVRHERQAAEPARKIRGRTTTPAERALATSVERAAHRAGFDAVRVEAKATRPGQPAHLALRGVPCSDAARVLTIAATAARTR